MNMLINTVQLVGRLGADAETKTTRQGTKVINVRFATNEYTKNGKGEWKEITYWHNLVFWGQLAEKLEKNKRKGTRLLIVGSLSYREYKDVHDIKREVANIKVQQFMVIHEHPFKIDAKPADHEEEDLPF